MTWQQYRSHKIVTATPIVSIVEGLWVEDGNEPFMPTVPAMAEKASVGDYAVIYEDGYRSVSPKVAFEDGYTAI